MTPPDSTAVRAPTARVPHLSATAVAWIRVNIPRAVPAANDAAQREEAASRREREGQGGEAAAASDGDVRGRTGNLATSGAVDEAAGDLAGATDAERDGGLSRSDRRRRGGAPG